MMRSSRYHRKKLRKQPRMRRLEAEGPLGVPKVQVPSAAKKRKRRNDPRIQVPLEFIRTVAFTPRWMSLVLVAVSVWALVLIGQNETFYLSVIPVRGAKSITQTEIIETSGLEGSHVFAANPEEAASRIKDIPGVISATVTLRWPNKVNIEVREDTPVAIWKHGGNIFWINREGKLLPARTAATGLLVIESEESLRTTKDSSFVAEPIIDGALQLKELRPNIEHLFFRPETGLSYQDGRGWRGHFGTGSDMEQKLVVYETIVDELLKQGRHISYISVRNQTKPFYKAEPF